MASSENQGLQIVVIILFGFMIVLSVTTFIFFKDYQEADNRARPIKRRPKALGDLNVEKGNLKILKELIGFKDPTRWKRSTPLPRPISPSTPEPCRPISGSIATPWTRCTPAC